MCRKNWRGLLRTADAGHGAGGPQRRLRRAALPHGREEGGRARAHRRGDHLHQRHFLSPAGGNARGLSESVPPGDPHEAARQEGRRRGHPGRAGGILARPDLPDAPSRRAPARYFRPAQPLCRTAAPLPPRRGGAQPGHRRTRARVSASRWWPPMARPTPRRRSANCWTCSPACATKSRSPRPAACWSATPNAT